MRSDHPEHGGTALLFPGQGSQTSEMRSTVAASRPDLLELSIALVGEDPFPRVEEGTRFAQPAVFAASIACWERAGKPDAAFLAGHSLGEIAALVAAGCLDSQDGLRLAVVRGRLMQEAAENGRPGGMLAVLGSDEFALEVAAKLSLTLANFNAPGQIVLSGPADDLAGARKLAKAEGVRTMRVAVQGAFHSPAMQPAVAAFRRALDRVPFVEPRKPVYSSTTAAPFSNVREALAGALTQPVRWLQTLRALQDRGASRFLEAGPGRVLTGLVRRSLESTDAENLDREPANA
jgi:[acyl-carrier-protein] S-malonyltransferase